MNKTIIIPGLIIAGAIAFFVSPFASKSPDGLERVIGSADKREFTPVEKLAGVGLTFGIAFGAGFLLGKRKK